MRRAASARVLSRRAVQLWSLRSRDPQLLESLSGSRAAAAMVTSFSVFVKPEAPIAFF